MYYILVLLSLNSIIDAASVVINAGSQAKLQCHTSQRTAVDWWYQRVPTDNTRQICLNGEVVVEMRSRFSIYSPNTGDYDLVIIGVDLADSGIYTCVEEAGFGQRTTIHLLVTVSGLNQSTPEAYSTLQAPEVDRSEQCTGYREPRGFLSVVVIIVLLIIIAVLLTIVCTDVFRKTLRKRVDNYPSIVCFRLNNYLIILFNFYLLTTLLCGVSFLLYSSGLAYVVLY